ncbi:unnamed protein product [Effrenium voratum]|nr:unnamed protein product [Effrenium voratum]
MEELLGSLSLSVRVCLVVLTSTHLVCLMTLNFLSWGGATVPVQMQGVFGEVGRTVMQFPQSITTCVKDPPPELWCPNREESLWPGLHLGAVMLLHFVLTNVSEGNLPSLRANFSSSSSSRMGKTLSDTNSMASHDMSNSGIWTLRLLRCTFMLSLLAFALAFPSILTMPLLAVYIGNTFMSARLAESSYSNAQGMLSRFARTCRRCCGRDGKEPRCGMRTCWTRYVMLLFFLVYIYNVLEVYFHFVWPEARGWAALLLPIFILLLWIC